MRLVPRLFAGLFGWLLAESGYAPGYPPEWIETLNPQSVLLNVGVNGRRVLPSPETLEAVEGYPLLRTDRNGWIHLTTDGERSGWRWRRAINQPAVAFHSNTRVLTKFSRQRISIGNSARIFLASKA